MAPKMVGIPANMAAYTEQAGRLIEEKWATQPHVFIIVGSGLDYVAELVTIEVEISCADIPGFPVPRARGHSGSLLLGRWNHLNVALLAGRGHYYEGYAMDEIARPVQTLAKLGSRILLVTSAVGGVSPQFIPGTLALVRDHINLVQANPLIGPNDESLGPRYPDLLRAYSPKLRSDLQDRLKAEIGKTLPEAVLGFLSGPCFETEAELNWLRYIGADIVGWSLVPEVIAGIHAGMEVIALALVTDFSHPSEVERIDVDQIFQIGPSHKDVHLPIFRAALATVASTLMGTSI